MQSPVSVEKQAQSPAHTGSQMAGKWLCREYCGGPNECQAMRH